MKKFSIVAGAALAAAAILVGAQNSARAQDQMFGYGGRDFCYEGWQT